MSRYVLGVDGGTTKTIALVADDQGCILGAGRGGNSNWTGADVEIPMRVVAAAAREALEEAALSGDDISAGVFGLAGADWPEDYERRQAVLEKSGVAQQVIIKNDALVGWRAGTQARYGVVITAGTGTNTCIKTPDGLEWCYGYYEDGGGGWDLAEKAVRAVLRAEDGRGAPTMLTAAVLESLGYSSAEALLRARIAAQADIEAVASLCPLVFDVADAGDEVAAELIVDHGVILAEYATAAIRRFEMQRLEFDVVLSGSVFKGKGQLLRNTIMRAIQQVAPRAHIVRPRFEPAVGGVLLAYDAQGIDVTTTMYENLAQTVPSPEFFSTKGGSGAS